MGEVVKIDRENITREEEKDRYSTKEDTWINITSGISVFISLETFYVWMQISPTSPVRKFYGIINSDLKGEVSIKVNDSMFYWRYRL